MEMCFGTAKAVWHIIDTDAQNLLAVYGEEACMATHQRNTPAISAGDAPFPAMNNTCACAENPPQNWLAAGALRYIKRPGRV